MKPSSILIVEDEAVVALDLKLQLQSLGYAVAGVAASAEKALQAVAAKSPDLVLMDVRLQGPGDGITAAEEIRSRHGTPLIFLTSHSDDDTVQRAARTAPYGYLTKPYQIRELRAGIEVALAKSRMERQLREADRWFADTLHCVTDGVIVTDLDSRVRFLNPAAERLTGWSSERAGGRGIDEVVNLRPALADPPAQPEIAPLVRQVLAEGRPTPVAHALRLVPLQGNERVVDCSAGPVNDDAGRRLGAVVVLRDAAERVAQESRLRSSEERFRSAFEFAPLGMALVTFAGEFIQVNDALCRMLRATREQLLQRSQTELTLELDREHEAQRLREIATSPTGAVQFEKRYRPLAGGDPIWTLVSVSRLHDADAATCHLYQVCDITAQKQAAERQVALAAEQLKRAASDLATRAKSEFLSRVSHEMRTPLNAVIGFAQLLQYQPATAAAGNTQAYARQIRAAGEHMLALVTDLLDLNQAELGMLRLEATALRLAPVVDEAVQWLRDEAARRGVAVDVCVAPELSVLADAQRLRQVLLNIGSNAVKYSRSGGHVTLRTEARPPGQVALVVEDQGIGMSEAQLEHLFQPFDRLGAERTQVPGTGLGLVIVRSLVQAMGGALSVHSRPGVGTTVTLELQAAP